MLSGRLLLPLSVIVQSLLFQVGLLAGGASCLTIAGGGRTSGHSHRRSANVADGLRHTLDTDDYRGGVAGRLFDDTLKIAIISAQTVVADHGLVDIDGDLMLDTDGDDGEDGDGEDGDDDDLPSSTTDLPHTGGQFTWITGGGNSSVSSAASLPLHLKKDYADLFVQNKREWADLHAYDYVHTIIQAGESTSAMPDSMILQSMHWVKIDLLLKYLHQYDWICWLDMDTVVVDSSVKLVDVISRAQLARPQVDLIMEGSENYKNGASGSIKSSVFLLRNSFWTRRLLQQLKEVLSDRNWLSIIRREVHGHDASSSSILDDALVYLLNSEHNVDSHLHFMPMQSRWDQKFLYMPRIGILHFTGCSIGDSVCLDIFGKAISHILRRDQLYVYQVAPYVQHVYNIFVAIYILFALDRLFHVVCRHFLPSPLRSFNKAKLPPTCRECDHHKFPLVVVQLPMYNEVSCCNTIIDAACNLDWPESRLLIQVVDDSTNLDARNIIQSCIYTWMEKGVNIQLCRRDNRHGFKAGAMNEAMLIFPDDAEFIAIFDADFQPEPSFLLRTVPYLMGNARVGFVQTMWRYTNAKESILTRMQEISLNYHFKCEQEVRFRTQKFFNFNGTAGVWRKRAIDEVGGWHTDTLVEDMDLSLRVFACGWKFIYLKSVQVFNEIPPTFEAYRGQQHRWTSGPMQVLKKAFQTIYASEHLSHVDKIFCLWFFLRNYIHVVNFMYFLIFIPMMIWIPRVTLYEWAVIWLPMAISVSNIIYTPSEIVRVAHYVLFENAMCLYKTGALICGVLNIGKAKQWIVTPKFARKKVSAEPIDLQAIVNAKATDDRVLGFRQRLVVVIKKFCVWIGFGDISAGYLLHNAIHVFDNFHVSSLKIHWNELLMALFLFLCGTFGVLMDQYGIGTFSLLNSLSYFILAIGYIGRSS